ncbi:S8 family serine peptidase [Halomicrococcus sp. NG-SE-24]|uniref:S8 family serine peptidase n=1 Tax=Halomicrococcus sp. NG-SE-24 TaxID=3436928 RepID=UPI003D972378
MNQSRRTFLKGIAATGVALTAAGQVSAGDGTRYIVVGSGEGAAKRIRDAGFSVERELGGNVLVVTADDRSALESVSGVSEVVVDRKMTLDAPKLEEKKETTTDEDLYPFQWDKQVTDVPEAHETATGDGTRIAIIDTGVDVDHPDLAANVNEDEGKLFKYGEISDDATDVYGHGTHVAGIAAASDDGTTGVVGTAPDAEIVSLRVFYYDDIDDDGEKELTTTRADLFTAIDHAAEIGADAANMSIGTPPIPPQDNAGGLKVGYQRVIQSASRRGTLTVVSAGNSSANLQQGGYFTLPNSVAGAMSVSATGPNDALVFYSNYGTNEVSVGAPGGGYETLKKTLCADWDGDGDGEAPIDEDGDGEEEWVDCEIPEWPYPTNLVLSSVPPELYDGKYYAYFAGTSMAAPQVTGTAALVRELASDANPNEVEQAIEQGAEGTSGKSDPELGAGRLNANRALDSI